MKGHKPSQEEDRFLDAASASHTRTRTCTHAHESKQGKKTEQYVFAASVTVQNGALTRQVQCHRR